MRSTLVIFLLALTPTTASSWSPNLARDLLFPSHSMGAATRYRREVNTWAHAPPSTGAPHVFSPIDFGGDPSGLTDSTIAVKAALAAVLNSSDSGMHDANGIRDCGGATLDLMGGEYLISSPLELPAYYGNLRITQGTLRASPTFPPEGFLINTGIGGGADGNNIDVLIDEVFLDAFQVAAGCIQAVGCFGGVIGPQVYIFNFTQIGIDVLSGHEVTIQQTWVGEYWWSDSRKENRTASVAVGVSIVGNDHVVSDVIVFSSRVGILIDGKFDIYSSAHFY